MFDVLCSAFDEVCKSKLSNDPVNIYIWYIVCLQSISILTVVYKCGILLIKLIKKTKLIKEKKF